MQIHAFYATKGYTLTALGIVSPRILYEQGGFDVLDCVYIGKNKVRIANTTSN